MRVRIGQQEHGTNRVIGDAPDFAFEIHLTLTWSAPRGP